jgi:hypothetical protein
MALSYLHSAAASDASKCVVTGWFTQIDTVAMSRKIDALAESRTH